MKMNKTVLLLIFTILLLSGCGSEENGYKGAELQDAGLEQVIISYFNNFDNIHEFSKYSTDGFIERVYSWCSGDDSQEKSLEEMKTIYFEINKDTLYLSDYYVDEISFASDKEAVISVTRSWEDGSEDSTHYSIVKVNDIWKFDDRF